MMAGAYDSLLKYALSLMKTNLPPKWRSIKTSNVFFQTRVACMKGALDVLKVMGYTIETGSSIEFPPEVALPDPERLPMVAAEIFMAKLEVEKMKREAESERIDRDSPPSSSHLSKRCWGNQIVSIVSYAGL